MPKFLEDYGDIFLSLSYYRQCLDKIEPLIDDFLETAADIRNNYQLKSDANLMKTCVLVESSMNGMMAAISGRYTNDMWQNLNAIRFRQVKSFIEDYHTTIGGSLCAISVKMCAWARLFPNREVGGRRGAPNSSSAR